MSQTQPEPCCPPFDPAPWNEKEFNWTGKLFVKERVHSFLHVPLDFGAAMARAARKIDAAGAAVYPAFYLSDENSLWGADLYVAAAKPVPGAAMSSFSGSFLAKAYEGPYRNMRLWISDMAAFAKSRGKSIRKLYFFYAACPRCAKIHGKNPVVLFAQV